MGADGSDLYSLNFHSFIHSGDFQETTTQRRSQPSHDQSRIHLRDMYNLTGRPSPSAMNEAQKGRSFHADGPTTEKTLRRVIAKRIQGPKAHPSKQNAAKSDSGP